MTIINVIHLIIIKTFHNYLINYCSFHQLHMTIVKTFQNYLISSLLSPTHLHGYEKGN
jgi:hypothetical protein